MRLLISAIALITRLASVLSEDLAQGDRSSCLLQVGSKQTRTQRDDCALPANGQWCQVKVGQAPFMMAVYKNDDIVSNDICRLGTWEVQDGDLAALGAPGSALDIGANVGFYSFLLAAQGWNVTAFEPLASNHELLDATMCANPVLAQRITMHKFGLGAKDDRCIMISGDDNLGDGVSRCGEDVNKTIETGFQKRAEMTIRRLDDVLTEDHAEKLDFVKMDVEGFECQVMAGGQSLLTKFRPRMIQSEVWHDMQGCLPQDYLASFANASYTVAKDRTCTIADLSRPKLIDNRYMCSQPKQAAPVSNQSMNVVAINASVLLSVAAINRNERKIVWLTPIEAL